MRTWLFVPGHETKMVVKALRSGADAVIIDWEDAVPPEAKALARERTRELLEHHYAPLAPLIIVRVNGARSEAFAADLPALRGLPVGAVMLAKAEGPEDVEACAGAGFPLILLVESALGVEEALALARAHAGVERLAFGSLDFLADIGASWSPDGEALLYARARLVSCSRAAGLEPPIDGVWPKLEDEAGLVRDAKLARALGFGGKLLVHPKQLAPVREAFAPSTDELERARRIVRAAAGVEAGGALRLGDEMIDPPVVRWARQLLEASREEVVAETDEAKSPEG